MVQQVPANLKHNPAGLVVPIVESVARDANVEVLAVGGAKRAVAGRVGAGVAAVGEAKPLALVGNVVDVLEALLVVDPHLLPVRVLVAGVPLHAVAVVARVVRRGRAAQPVRGVAGVSALPPESTGRPHTHLNQIKGLRISGSSQW